MTVRHKAPHPEWVEMYRRGFLPARIAALDSVAVTTVRYHMQIAVRDEPSLRQEHEQAFASARPRLSVAGLRRMAEVVAFFQVEDRLPTKKAKSVHERGLASWLYRRRKEAAAGTLSPIYREGLAVIPGWDGPSTHAAEAAARWQRRLQDLQEFSATVKDWPRHQKTADRYERDLGVWLHGQRIDYRAGRLDTAKEKQLNELLPGWREGRGHRGGRRRSDIDDRRSASQ